jgi:hypothetical protein
MFGADNSLWCVLAPRGNDGLAVRVATRPGDAFGDPSDANDALEPHRAARGLSASCNDRVGERNGDAGIVPFGRDRCRWGRSVRPQETSEHAVPTAGWRRPNRPAGVS